MYTLSCLAKIRSNGRSLSHHCSSGIRCLNKKKHNTSVRNQYRTTSIIYSRSVLDLRISTGVNSLCRLIKPNTTALSGVLQTTFP
jgi:hypothetical protein